MLEGKGENCEVIESTERKDSMKEKVIVATSCIVLFFAMLLLNVYIQHEKEDVKQYQQMENENQNGTLYNAWIIKGEEQGMTALVNGTVYEFELKKKINQKLEKVVADLEVKEGVVQKIVLKEDTIHGKVLSIDEESIEVEGYGALPVGKGYKVYKIYDELEQKSENDVLLGYDIADFVVADGKICAALIRESVKIGDIRVLLKTNGHASEYHDKVTLTGTTDFTVKIGKKKTTYKKGEKVTFTPKKADFSKSNRISITPQKDGKIKILSMKRSDGNPSYRGNIEVNWKKGKGLVIINELSLEEYLYGVIGSEMPVSYGEEALKVQAVCARSYAYKQLLYGGCGKFGAHVDDSVSYQVYNNTAECKETINAVNKTEGEILKYNGDVVTAYFFSTSCGHTASAADVWSGESNEVYLDGKVQNKKQKSMDLSKEKKFISFIKNKEYDSFDKDFPWYRWQVTISAEELQQSVEKNIVERYQKNNKMILTKQKDGSFSSQSINSVGKVTGIKVLERGKSGVIKSIQITGTKATIKVITEYNIRLILAPLTDTIYRNDDSQVQGMSMLPSGFFYVEKNAKKGEFTFYGGGYGHGVGMSQNGAKAMVDEGYTYEEILQHYYTDVDIVSIGE